MAERSLERAAFAQEPIALRALPGSLVDSDAGYRARAFGARLDGASLRLRAIVQIGRLDPGRALALFRETSPPIAPASGCETPLVADLDLYVEVARKALEEWARGGDRDDDRRDLLWDLAMKAATPAQTLAAIELLAHSRISDEAREEALSVLAARMSGLWPHPRETALVLHPKVGLTRLRKAVAELDRRGIPVYPILSAFRAMALRHYRAGVCDEEVHPSRAPIDGLLDSAAVFDRELAPYLALNALEPFSADEAGSEKVRRLGSAKVTPLWASQSARGILNRLKALRAAPGGAEAPAENGTGEKEAAHQSLLTDLESWSYDHDRGESPEAYFHEKALAHRVLVELAPTEQSKMAALRSLLSFLEMSVYQRASRVAWFLEASEVIKNPDRYAPGADASIVLEALIASRDPVLSAYGRLARLGAAREP